MVDIQEVKLRGYIDRIDKLETGGLTPLMFSLWEVLPALYCRKAYYVKSDEGAGAGAGAPKASFVD